MVLEEVPETFLIDFEPIPKHFFQFFSSLVGKKYIFISYT